MGNKCVFIGEDGFPDKKKITLEKIYDSSLNEEFVKQGLKVYKQVLTGESLEEYFINLIE